jgi:trimeric autotransporter adhesin
VTASQSGNGNYSAASPVTQSTSATPAAQAITVTFVPTTATKSSMFTVMATGGGSGNALVYTNSTGDNCSNAGATYTMGTKATACSVIINQAGNANYSAAAQVTKTVTVAAAIACGSQCSITGAPASAPYLSTFTVGTTSGSDTSVPTVTAAGACTIGGSTVSMTKGTGTCTITAIWAANYVYEKATVTAKVTATKGATVTSITGNTPNPCTSVPCTVAVNSTVMQSPANATYATGNVVVTASTGEHCSAAVSTGLSSCNLVFHTTGSRTITATYNGNGNDSASTSAPVSQGVN